MFSNETVLGLVPFAPEEAGEGCVADPLGVLGALALVDRSGRARSLIALAPEAAPGQAAERCVANRRAVFGALARLDYRNGR